MLPWRVTGGRIKYGSMFATNRKRLDLIRRVYRPLIELGRGGMAKVYLAESLASGLKKLVVLKVLNQNLAADAGMRSAFLREAELSARMNHPNVVQVLEVVEHAISPVMVMEYLDGMSLSAVLAHVDRKLSLPLHLHILIQVLTGLHYFHELKDYDGTPLHAVHRDVSPHNVMVLHDGLIKVLDFGIAKVSARPDQSTHTGVLKGKIGYMPPEQLLSDPDIDRRADIFAVGVMLWEAAAQRRLWEGMTESQQLRALIVGEIPHLSSVVPEVPEDLERIVGRALAIERSERYATAREMSHDIEQYLLDRAEHVQARDLAEFMLQHFSDVRQSRDGTVRAAMRNPSAGLRELDCATRPRPLSVAPPPGYEAGSSPAQVSSVPAGTPGATPRGRLLGKWGWGLVALVASVLIGVWITQRGDQKSANATLAPAVRTVELEVEALPAGSEILMDGKRLGYGRYRGTHCPQRGIAGR